MARPRAFATEDVEDALLRVFWARGYANTSIDDLTGATGVLRGSLYAAYRSKEGMFRVATRRYLAELATALATRKKGLEGARHVLDTVARLTVADPERRGCLVLNAIPESHALGTDTRAELHAALGSMQALLRARLREAQAKAGTDVDLEPIVAMLFAAAVAIRVLGRAGAERRLLRKISTGAIESARRWFARGKE